LTRYINVTKNKNEICLKGVDSDMVPYSLFKEVKMVINGDNKNLKLRLEEPFKFAI
jgi:hypothetical protein